MIFKRSKSPSALQQAGASLGLAAGPGRDGGVQGQVDGVPVVVTHPITPDPSGPGGLWILVGPTAHNWITNAIPDADTRPVERVDTPEYVGDLAAWLGMDVSTRASAGDLAADDIVALVRSAVARFSTLT